jgi:hypothetical protein
MEHVDEDGRPSSRRGFRDRVTDAAGALLRAAASAGELLADRELRKWVGVGHSVACMRSGAMG